ncbi:MAG TPA: glucose-6-phosphate isomerase [Geminicoccus sp.]|uniref:glucose-6-phosphate isomerase n=1 Tax=Geminicoccus sp. TaxID=2024832 RepID=UPI002E309F04|nr:glucose-6-phosphate isomerase [Geminicoccus sp.]HEX2528824.1 glucose-6-phosphate isomerase [Geminicoccus sp.]
MNQQVNEAFEALRAHGSQVKKQHLRILFEQDPQRFQRFSAEACWILMDYSKSRITADTLPLLEKLAKAAGIEARRDAMYAGERINTTENRAVLHTALRNRSNTPVLLDGKDVMPDVNGVLAAIEKFTDAVRNGTRTGSTGKPFTDVVNIGIGGSDLGPRMVVRALSPDARRDLRVHFVANVDPSDMHDVLATLDPSTTLFVIASKTFTTMETMTNGRAARAWVADALGEDAVGAHFVAVSTNAKEVSAFGISTEEMFGFWDWVGGRYSLWSAIGLPIALSVGFAKFAELLDGAHQMDLHFKSAPILQNLPMLLGLLRVWEIDVMGSTTVALLPYDQRLELFTPHLQQVDMESNGKGVMLDGAPVVYGSGPVVWGSPGTNGQHAFHQLIHQGNRVIPCEFLLARHSRTPIGDGHQKLIANCLAQSEALMRGKNEAEVRAELTKQGLSGEALENLVPHKLFTGNRPSITFLYEQLDARTLGSITALYEHAIFVQGTCWNVNSFDQWGVELGKQLALPILDALTGGKTGTHDASRAGLLARIGS